MYLLVFFICYAFFILYFTNILTSNLCTKKEIPEERQWKSFGPSTSSLLFYSFLPTLTSYIHRKAEAPLSGAHGFRDGNIGTKEKGRLRLPAPIFLPYPGCTNNNQQNEQHNQ